MNSITIILSNAGFGTDRKRWKNTGNAKVTVYHSKEDESKKFQKGFVRESEEKTD